jgi:hypothetical protein
MASPTTTQPTPPPKQQAPTPGVGATPGSVTSMAAPEGAAAQTFNTPPADPVLFDDIDPVLLLRLYPDSKSHEEMRSLAMQAGLAAKEAGLHLRAAQDGEPPPEPTPRRHPQQEPHREA